MNKILESEKYAPIADTNKPPTAKARNNNLLMLVSGAFVASAAVPFMPESAAIVLSLVSIVCLVAYIKMWKWPNEKS
jgi:hypothetical protein